MTAATDERRGELLRLAERCEAASGPDRELDAVIAAVLRTGERLPSWTGNFPESWEGRADGRVYLERGGPSYSAPKLTASLDAALALAGEELPGWSSLMAIDPNVGAQVCLMPPDSNAEPAPSCATPALALCAALLRTLASQDDTP